MSIGILVIEVAEYSGSRVTARCAIEQNRDVYAVPGNVTTKNAWGPNTLIEQGAKLTATWEDVWEELPTPVRPQHRLASKERPAASLFTEEAIPASEASVMSILRHDEALQLDEIKSLSLNSAPPKSLRHSSNWSWRAASGNFLAKITSGLSERVHVSDHREYARLVARRKTKSTPRVEEQVDSKWQGMVASRQNRCCRQPVSPSVSIRSGCKGK